MHCALLSQRYSYMCRTGLNLELVCRLESLVRLCVFRHQVFQPSSLSSCLPACGLCFCSSCIHTTEMLGKEKEKKKRKFSTSFLLPSSRYGRQPETQRRPASHLQSAVVFDS